MPRVGLILARYVLHKSGEATGFIEQTKIIDDLNKAPPVAYRVKEPTADDKNTYIIRPETITHKKYNVLTWVVCKDIHQREVRRVDRVRQTVNAAFEDTDDCQTARVVAIPSLGVIASEDVAGDRHLDGWSAIRRMRVMVEELDDELDFSATLAGTSQDLQRAIATWELDRFSFQARPFNPHPSNPGLILSSLLEKDGVGELRGVALPKEGGHISPKADGIVKEAIGLADKGYATYGAEGRTPSGAEATVMKQPFSFDRNQNLKRLSGPQRLRVYIDADNEEEQLKKIIDVMLDFFAPDAEE